MGSWWGSRVGVLALLAAGVAGAVVQGLWACGGASDGPPGAGEADAAELEEASTPIEEAGPATPDAGADAKPSDPPKTFCATRTPAPRFCDDFDDGDLRDDWSVLTVLNGEADLDPTTSTSAPASFVVGTAPIGGTQSAHVHLRTTAGGAPTGHVVFSFDVLLEAVTFTQGVVAIATLDVAANHSFTLYLRDGDADAPAATLEENSPGSATRHVLSALPAAGAWTRATIDVDLPAATATVLWGTETALDAAPILAGAAKDPTIRVGAVYVYGPAASFGAHFDNVTLDF
ncbi:MAG: hypothetical protein KIS78_15125 [Labilithrix sp.]|nr:hypothetical protein [Labilithrix sp.]